MSNIPRHSYHVTPKQGWMNDPNGFIYFKGKYHCFFQYHPTSNTSDQKSWGHAVSNDLIKWEYLPLAIQPDKPYDIGGCWSGGAIEKDGKLYLIYTGVCEQNGKPIQQQCLAVSEDGVNFEKSPLNPIISDKNMPKGASRKDCRDPFIWFDNGWYNVLLGSIDGQVLNGTPQLLMYRSKDLKEFSFVSTPVKGEEFSLFCECPNIAKCDNNDVLFVSLVCKQAQKHRFNNLASTIYCAGKMDYSTGVFNVNRLEEVDFGTDFYATQTIVSPEYKNPIVIAWLNMWSRRYPSLEQDGWAGAFTLPREVLLKNNRLYMKPVKSVYNYLKNSVDFGGEFEGEMVFDGVNGIYAHLKIEMDLSKTSSLEIRFFCGDGYYTSFIFDNNFVTFDRSHSQFQPLGCDDEVSKTGIRQAPLKKRNGKIHAEFFLDGCCVEGFFEHGKLCMSCNSFNTTEKTGITFVSKGKVTISATKSDIILD